MNDGSDLETHIESLLRGAGLEPRRRETIVGARGSHEFDVVVDVTSMNLTGRWVVECKDWSSPVPKDIVGGFCSRVENVGAEKGIMVATSGFQSGCFAIVESRNVRLLTTIEFEGFLADEIAWTRLRIASRRLDALESHLAPMLVVGTLHAGEQFRRGFDEHFPTGPSSELYSERRGAIEFLQQSVTDALAGRALYLPDLDYDDGNDELPPDDWYPSYRVKSVREFASSVDDLLNDWEPWADELVRPT